MPDRPGGIEVVDALVRAAARFGWRTEVAEVSDFQVRILVLPPLAESRTERNRWPDEPEEAHEHHLGERR